MFCLFLLTFLFSASISFLKVRNFQIFHSCLWQSHRRFIWPNLMSYIEASFGERIKGCTITFPFPVEPHQSHSVKNKGFSLILKNIFLLIFEWFLLNTCSTSKYFFSLLLSTSPALVNDFCKLVICDIFLSKEVSFFIKSVYCCHWLSLCSCSKRIMLVSFVHLKFLSCSLSQLSSPKLWDFFLCFCSFAIYL